MFAALEKLDQDYSVAINDKKFLDEFEKELKTFVGRPSPIFHAQRWSKRSVEANYILEEDLNHTGAHKINNTIGQVLLAKRTGKKRVIAETGAGQHGVATATVAARFGMNVLFTWVRLMLRDKLKMYTV